MASLWNHNLNSDNSSIDQLFSDPTGSGALNVGTASAQTAAPAAQSTTVASAATVAANFTVDVSGVWTSPLATIAIKSGLAANANIATFAETGGTASDSYTYSIGGTGASSFATTATGILSTGAGGVSGSNSGKLYSLTVTGKDTTTGASASTSINVVAGSGSADTINLSQISGIATGAPTFVYGSSGSDKISGTGMTGHLYIYAGGGADTLTGGSGGNSYEFGAASDSTASAMDIITNFNAKTDILDFSGTGLIVNATTNIATNATTLAANSVTWNTVGGNTFVYVNGANKAVALSAANMKVELQGTITLGAANIAHN